MFGECKKLSEVELSYGLPEINDGMFASCTSLTELAVPSSVRNVGYEAFAGSGLSSIDLQPGLISIERAAFFETNLSNITIPEGVTEIADDTFEGCETLSVIALPDSVTSISETAFPYTYNTQSGNFDYTAGLTIRCHLYKLSSLPDFVVTTAYEFADQHNIAVELVSMGTFSGRQNENDITVSWELDCETGVLSLEGKGKLDFYALPGEDNPTNAALYSDFNWYIPSGADWCVLAPYVRSVNSNVPIGDMAFRNTGDLESGDYSNLEEVHLTETIYGIGQYAFENCTNLKRVTIDGGYRNYELPEQNPYEYLTIQRYAFENCPDLTYVRIPWAFDEIHDKAFEDSPNVTVYCYTGSPAHEYAIANDIAFVLLDPHDDSDDNNTGDDSDDDNTGSGVGGEVGSGSNIDY
jgi:hypothetical protein